MHAQAMHGRADTPPLGVHALVFEGGWSREEAKRVIAGSAKAGYDLVEGVRRYSNLHGSGGPLLVVFELSIPNGTA